MKKNKKPNPEQIDFIKGNIKTSSPEVIASVLHISVVKLQAWCDDTGIVLDLSFKPAAQFHLPVRKEQGRPAARYSNISREHHVERWLKKAV